MRQLGLGCSSELASCSGYISRGYVPIRNDTRPGWNVQQAGPVPKVFFPDDMTGSPILGMLDVIIIVMCPDETRMASAFSGCDSELTPSL